MHRTAAPEEHARLLRRATAASVATATLLAASKVIAFLLTDSLAVLASLVDSLMDTGASLITAFAVRYSLRPADDEHRFGHGKSEAIAALAQSAFIGASAAFLIARAIDRFMNPQPLESIPGGLIVMAISIAATCALVLYQRRVVRATGSTAIRADALHFLTDLATNSATVLALALSAYGMAQLDPVFAVLIACSTLYGAVRIARDALAVLMDRELPLHVQERVRQIALAHSEVLGVHDLRTRQSGPTLMIQFHLEMDGDISLSTAHRISVEVEDAIRDAFPSADVVIHQDPAGVAEPRQFP